MKCRGPAQGEGELPSESSTSNVEEGREGSGRPIQCFIHSFHGLSQALGSPCGDGNWNHFISWWKEARVSDRSAW